MKIGENVITFICTNRRNYLQIVIFQLQRHFDIENLTSIKFWAHYRFNA